MRDALWGAISQVWERCLEDERAQDPSVVFVLDSETDSSTVAWNAHRHPLFSRYLEYLADETRMYLVLLSDSETANKIASWDNTHSPRC